MSTLYLTHIDKSGARSVQQHQVWDREKFIASCQNNAKEEGGRIELATEEEYRETNWRKA